MKRFAKLYQGTDGFCQVKERENGEYVLYDEANARIAELETAQAQSKQNYELEVAHWKRIAEDAQIRASVAILPSVLCAENHVQNCHICDRLDCGDNTSEAKKRIAELEAALKRQESELRECEAFWKSQKTIKESR